MSGVRFVTYYTPDYRVYLKEWKLGMVRYRLNYSASMIPFYPGGQRLRWARATGHKPLFLDTEMAATNKNLVWLDVDSRILGHPELLESMSADVSVHVAAYKMNREQKASGMNDYATGVVYLRNSHIARDFLAAWIKQQERLEKKHPTGVPDQDSFDAAVKKTGIHVQPLPASYRAKAQHEEPVHRVIEHLMASRRLKQ